METYSYIIVGGGLAGASAITGIREMDSEGTIVLLGDEKHLPYDRPPLTKKLWFGKTTLEKTFLLNRNFYEQNKAEVKTGVTVSSLDPELKTVRDTAGRIYRYEKLLLATGGRPSRLPIPGGSLEGICYYRYMDDYRRIRDGAAEGKTALVIGGGFIGSEIAAALSFNKVKVTMLFPEEYLCKRVFVESLGRSMQNYFTEKGIRVFHEKPVSISKKGDDYITLTDKARMIDSDMVIAGIGIKPEIQLAAAAGLITTNGIIVNEYLPTTNPDIYAAGDNACFPCTLLGKMMRMEHWDNALSQGRHAGRNMAGQREPFKYLPYFFSDLFDFGYEAVGEVDASFETTADWQEKNRKGIIYYVNEGKIRGIMLCNVWNKVEAARQLLMRDESMIQNGLEVAA